MLFAEVPQILNKNVTYLRNFRKRDAEKKRIFAEGKRSQTKQNQTYSSICRMDHVSNTD